MMGKKLLRTVKTRFPKLFQVYYWILVQTRFLILSDKQYVIKHYVKRFGVKPNLSCPKKYNEHVVKIILSPPSSLMTVCADKYAVREYLKQKDCASILNDLIGVYDRWDDLRDALESFPHKFALKATHGSHWNYICQDKSTINMKSLEKEVKLWLKSNFYRAQRERVYKNIPPRVICEKYLQDESGGLTDYKFHCFKGEPKFFHVAVGRYTNMVYNTYDVNGKYLDVAFFKGQIDPNLRVNPILPLNQMLDYCRILSSDFDYVRVDLYYVNGRIIFSELTFTPGNAHFDLPVEDDLLFGKFFTED